uniref:OSJNBa0082E08.3 protein n=1 Tax=Oryza sativa subsp. japonica TaxID=39947 RepID=Q7X6Q2_ORYSJ|nr:OSJNBa0082E08.3 [Oryza sativa Japonica Group]
MEANASVDIDDQHVCLKISNQESTTSMFRSHKQRHLVRLTDAQLALRQDASTENKETLCSVIQSIKLPYGYASNIASFGETIGSAQDVKFDAKTLTQAHRYVLRHLDEIEDFRREFLEEEKRKQKKSVFTSFESDKLINERFHDWLYHKCEWLRGPRHYRGLDLLQNGVRNPEIDIPRNDQYVEEQNISNENWCTNWHEYLLGSYLGTLVRKPHLAPLNILKWNDKIFIRIYHQKMITEVKRKFAIDGRAKSWLLHQLDGKWRQYKGKLKGKYYKPNLPMERVLQTVPNTVDESRWPTLVSYWYSKDSKKISDRNQENALKHPHTLGRKSFTRKRKELNEVYMKLAEKRVDSPRLTEADLEQAMLDMFGKDHSGRVRGMGPTITPTNYYGGRFLNISAINEQGTSSKKYPEDNLLARLPPSLTRLIPTSEVNQNQEVQAPNTAPSPSQRASSQPSTEEE